MSTHAISIRRSNVNYKLFAAGTALGTIYGGRNFGIQPVNNLIHLLRILLVDKTPEPVILILAFFGQERNEDSIFFYFFNGRNLVAKSKLLKAE